MKRAVSNIGWAPDLAGEVLPQLRPNGVEGLVIAPTMALSEGPYSRDKEVDDFRRMVEGEGLRVVGMQSLTYGLEGASFADAEGRRVLTDHLTAQAELAGKLGATSLIFGSPGLRQSPDTDPSAVAEVFTNVGETAHAHRAKLCIEPLAGYGNNFVTTTAEGIAFVTHAAESHPGVGLHLDSAALAGAGEDPAEVIPQAKRTVGIQSFDMSAPDLGEPSRDETVDQEAMGDALAAAEYQGFVSLEMRQPTGDQVAALLREIDFMRRAFSN